MDSHPQVLCPSHKDVFSLLKKMIDQVLEAHPNSKYLHVGCDELFVLGNCSRCRKMMRGNNWERDHLFFNHVKRIAQYIVQAYPKVRPIMWNDVLIKERAKFIEEYKLADIVDIMVWSYNMDVPVDVPDDLLEVYRGLFKSVWIASSYKGSTGGSKIIPDAKYHLTNHISWMDLVSKWKRKIGFKGIALTGWQRYDHFSVRNELLPVSIPSLTLALSYLNGTKKDVEPSVMTTLNCDSPIGFAPSPKIPECRFPRFPVYKIINKFYIFITEPKLPSSYSISGWMSAYNVANRFVSPSQVEKCVGCLHLNQTRSIMRIFEKKLRKALSRVYDEHTVDEWITDKVTVLRTWLDAVYYLREALLEQEWPRRPLLDITDGIL